MQFSSDRSEYIIKLHLGKLITHGTRHVHAKLQGQRSYICIHLVMLLGVVKKKKKKDYVIKVAACAAPSGC